jgi:hypothetical protein
MAMGLALLVSAGPPALHLFSHGENVCVQFTLPDHEAPVAAESTICWSKTGHLKGRFASITEKHTSELQTWLSQELEQFCDPGGRI